MIKQRPLHILLIILFQFSALQLDSQGFTQLNFKSLSVNDGLSQHDVSCVLQDSKGYIWIGTYDGLNRFDGYNIENFSYITNNPESLSGNRILCLYEDSQKRLWIGTDGEGLNYFDLQKERFIRINTPDRYKVINDVIEDRNGNILVATSRGLLQVVENESQPSTQILQNPISMYMVTKAVAGNTGIYFATNNGIWLYKEDKDCNQIEATKDLYISIITKDTNGKIWGGGTGLLACVEETGETFNVTMLNIEADIEIVSLCVSKDNTLWAGSLNHGLLRVDATKMSLSETISSDDKNSKSLLRNSILSLYCDHSNTIWIANRQGLIYASLLPKTFSRVPINLAPNIQQDIQALLADRNYLYFGMQNGRCYRHDMENNSIKKIALPPNIFPIKFYKFDDHIYLTSNLGVFRSDREGLHFEQLSIQGSEGSQISNIFSVCRDRFGSWYYGSYNGLFIKTENESDWIHYLYEHTDLLFNKRIFTLFYDHSSNCIWVGTISEGIYKINLNEAGELTTVEPYHRSMNNNYHIASNAIWCFYKDRKGNLWAGTDAGLLFKPKESSVFSHISTTGIIDKKIMAIMEDDLGKLWLSNSQGIIAFDPDSENVERFSYTDGLSTSTFNEAVDKDEHGNIYFGSNNGINFFNPSEIKQSDQINNVFFTGLKVHQSYVQPQTPVLGSNILTESINETDFIRLNYRQNNFSIEFAGSNVIDAKESLFRYKLEGYDEDWITTNGKYHFASYSNLKPGDYTFLVEAANKDDIWSNDPKHIQIAITPAPWKTVWAIIIYITILVTLIAVFLYFLYNRQKLRQKIHLDQLHHEKEQKIHELKLEFFTDVAHEFKTPLSLIIGPLKDLMQKDLTKDVKEFCFQVISRNTKRMMFLVNQLLDFRKISADVNILNVSEKNMSDFIEQTSQAFMWQAQNENIHFNIVDSKDFTCYFDSNLLEKVLYNIISNAFKYTPQNGIIELEVKPIWKNQLQVANIIIRDSGKGIPDEEKNKIFERFFHGKDRYSSGIGLHLSYTLIKAHKGEITVADSNYGGAEFVLTIPVSKEAFSENEINEGEKVHKWPQDIFKSQNNQSKPIAPERERILIVEDDHDLRAYLRSCLQTRYHLSEASNGVKGLKLAQNDLPDIIITDVMMPEMDGMEMCKKIKEMIETSHIPILMLTAKSDEEYQKQGLDCGAWDYITKPFNTDALLKKVDNIIETRNRFKSYLVSQDITNGVKRHYTTFDQKIIAKVMETIKLHLDDPEYSVEDLAKEIGLSRMQLHRKLKSLIGITTTGYINSIRITHAKDLFDNGCDRIQEAMIAVGINSYSHFNNTFKKIVGISPSEYIKKQQQTVDN